MKRKNLSKNIIDIPTRATLYEIKDSIEDECGVVYSNDGLVLLFCKDKDLTQYTVRSGTQVICDYAFYQSQIKAINLPDSLKVIGMAAFSDCFNLISTTIPEGVLKIECSAFRNCEALIFVGIPNSVTYIGYDAFYGCIALPKVVLPKDLTSIEPGLLSHCSSLKEVIIHNRVTKIDIDAFGGCTCLEKISLPNSVLSIGARAFCSCDALTEFSIPNGVTIIEDEIFSWCLSLKKVYVPDSVTKIGYSAFEQCPDLTSIEIPSSVTSIGSSAFSSCVQLNNITSLNVTPPNCEDYVFHEIDVASCTLHVPIGSKEAYSTAKGWEDFLNIVEME